MNKGASVIFLIESSLEASHVWEPIKLHMFNFAKILPSYYQVCVIIYRSYSANNSGQSYTDVVINWTSVTQFLSQQNEFSIQMDQLKGASLGHNFGLCEGICTAFEMIKLIPNHHDRDLTGNNSTSLNNGIKDDLMIIAYPCAPFHETECANCGYNLGDIYSHADHLAQSEILLSIISPRNSLQLEKLWKSSKLKDQREISLYSFHPNHKDSLFAAYRFDKSQRIMPGQSTIPYQQSIDLPWPNFYDSHGNQFQPTILASSQHTQQTANLHHQLPKPSVPTQPGYYRTPGTATQPVANRMTIIPQTQSDSRTTQVRAGTRGLSTQNTEYQQSQSTANAPQYATLNQPNSQLSTGQIQKGPYGRPPQQNTINLQSQPQQTVLPQHNHPHSSPTHFGDFSIYQGSSSSGNNTNKLYPYQNSQSSSGMDIQQPTSNSSQASSFPQNTVMNHPPSGY